MIKTETCYIRQIFDNDGCPCKQNLKSKVGNHTQLNLSSRITVYLFAWHYLGEKSFPFAEVYTSKNILFKQFAKAYTHKAKKNCEV